MHAFVDKYTVSVASTLLKNSKWFSQSVESAGFDDYLNSIELSIPEISGEGFYEIAAKTQSGTLDPAFHVAQWLGPEYPTVIYHHGNNETPFNYGIASKNTFKKIFLAEKSMYKANLISLRAPFHNQGLKFYLKKIGHLSNFVALLTASVRLEEALVQYLKDRRSRRVMITGMSLGGWVTNLHRSFYNTADVYVPIFAGAALDELFTTSCYRKLASRKVIENPDAVRVLNFEEKFQEIDTPNVHPLLARFDQIIVFDRQKVVYGAAPVSILNKGHVTGALAANDIRGHILAHL